MQSQLAIYIVTCGKLYLYYLYYLAICVHLYVAKCYRWLATVYTACVYSHVRVLLHACIANESNNQLMACMCVK